MTEQPAARQCYICGGDNPQTLQEHHIRPRAADGSDEPENTTWLCANCHDALHRLYDTNELADRVGIGLDDPEQRGGPKVDPRWSRDREIPESCPHVRFEDWHIEIGLWNIEKFLDHWRNIPEWDRRTDAHFHGQTEYIVSVCEEHAEKVPIEFSGRERTIDSGGEKITSRPSEYVVTPEEKRVNPIVTLVEASSMTWSSTFQRLHCGYCHRVFTSEEHSDMARHLRMKHGITDIYDHAASEHSHFNNASRFESPVAKLDRGPGVDKKW